jgi:uncharacterized protein YkvS
MNVIDFFESQVNKILKKINKNTNICDLIENEYKDKNIEFKSKVLQKCADTILGVEKQQKGE